MGKRRPVKFDWFPFYHGQFYKSEKVISMTHEQQGCYIRLLTHQWNGERASFSAEWITGYLRPPKSEVRSPKARI